MSRLDEELERHYAVALAEHLKTGGEDSLEAAYTIGRGALAEGFGIVNIAEAHAGALRHAPPDGEAGAERAAAFFSETLVPFEMAFRGFREANDELIRLNAALGDRNAELERAKEIAEAATRELEAFSYSVSHDLRGPLRTIDGFSLVLLEDHVASLDETARHSLDRIRASAQQMAALIDDLLRLARVARADLSRDEVDLSAIARRVVQRMRDRDPQREVTVAIAGDMNMVGDARLLEVVLENLIGNAWKFTGKRQGARIEIGASVVEGRRAIFVRDNGAGFDMAHRGRLFTPFKRLHSHAEFEGTGIGLATVQRIVRRHGGRVWAEGEANRGATFWFTLEEDRAE